MHATDEACLLALRAALRAAPDYPQPATSTVRPAKGRPSKIRHASRPLSWAQARRLTWLTIDQASAIVQVTRETMRNWMDDQKVIWVETAGGQARVFAPSIWRTRPEGEQSRA